MGRKTLEKLVAALVKGARKLSPEEFFGPNPYPNLTRKRSNPGWDALRRYNEERLEKRRKQEETNCIFIEPD